MKKNNCFAIILVIIIAAVFCTALSAQEKKKNELFQYRPAQVQQMQVHSLNEQVLTARLEGVIKAAENAKLAIKDLSGYGPSRTYIDLAAELQFVNIDYFGLQPWQLCPYSMRVYPDANPASGIYYYYPRRYAINWNEEEGYFLRLDYKPEQAGKKNILIQARLSPGYSQTDKDLLAGFIKIYLKQRGRGNVTPKLIPLPAIPEARFNLAPFGISEDDIDIPDIEPNTGELRMIIQTNLDGRQVVVDQLSDLGIIGNVILEPIVVSERSDTLTSADKIPIDAGLQLCDREAFSRAAWIRQNGVDFTVFTNTFQFPVRLKHLVYLKEHAQGVEVRGYDLGNQQLLTGDMAKIPNSSINSEVDSGETLAAWFRFGLDCEDEALERIVSSLTGGVGSYPLMNVDIKVPEPKKVFEQYGVYRIVVLVRSDYFDPEGKKSITNIYELFESDYQKTLTFHLWDEGKQPSDRLLYEYRIGIETVDGSQFSQDTWNRPDELFLSSITVGANVVSSLMSEEEQE